LLAAVLNNCASLSKGSIGCPDQQCGERDGEESHKNLPVERAVGTEVDTEEEVGDTEADPD
jgi:hypothetical protein